MRQNGYDAATGKLALDAAGTNSFNRQIQFWTDYFADPAGNGGLPAQAISDPQELRQLTAFFAWTAWASVGQHAVPVDVNGVGYEVSCSSRTLRRMEAGQEISLVIDTHVREDAIRLYGFTSEVERSWFRTLQTIQGVGAKVALAVLGTLSTQDLANAIALQNWAAVEQAPGVGKKLAQRIVMELKDKAPALSVAGLNVPVASPGKAKSAASARPEHNFAAEAISALTNLGYQPAQAAQAVAVAANELGEGADTAKLIRRGLKELAR